MTEQEKVVRKFLELWSSRNADAMAELFAEDCVYDNVPQKKPYHGREAVRQWLHRCFEHLTRLDAEILNIATNGEWVLVERHDDHIKGDKHMVLPVMGAVRVVNGKIVMWRDYFDIKTVVDLGLV